MNNSEIFAARLKNARVMKGFSMDELVSKLGNTISKMTISKYEKCQLAPNSSIIISLAKTLNQPVDYFFRPFTMKIDSIRFRKLKSRLSAKDEKSIKENIADLIERYINIEEVCTASVKFESPFDDEIFSFEQIKKSAILLRKK